MKILIGTSLILATAISCHYVIIENSGKSSFWVDILLVVALIALVTTNVYTIFKLTKNTDLKLIIALLFSTIYYLILFIFPILQGSR